MSRQMFNNAVVAGMAICMAAVVYLQCENKLVGAFLFSLGLLTVIIFRKKLYTGCTGYLADARTLNDMYRHDFSGIGGFCVIGYMERFRELMVILFGNAVGAAILGTIVAFAIPDTREKAIALMQNKESVMTAMKLRPADYLLKSISRNELKDKLDKYFEIQKAKAKAGL